MSRRVVALLSFVGSLALVAGLLAPDARTDPPAAERSKGLRAEGNSVGRRVQGFRLPDPRDGRTVALADFKGKKAVVVVFLGTECPINNAFLPVLAAMHRQYGPRGVQFVGINANRQDTPDRVAAHARKYEVPFPMLKDARNEVADQFGAQRTPEAFVLDASGKVRYQGRIDDQFGIGYNRPGKPTRRDLAAALDEVLAGKPVSVPTTAVAGCFIGRVAKTKANGSVTYARHISRILQRNCQECHRPGQVAPMPLLTYDDAVAWADTIREVLGDHRMPPWFADPRYGKFSNDRTLPAEDRAALLAWLDNGTPRGEDRDLPPPRTFAEGWIIGKPDVVLKMPKAYAVPAEAPRGGIPYRYFSIETNFKEDRWVERAEARPDATAVVHHILVYIVPPDEFFDPDGPGEILCGTAPGDMPLILRPGQGKKVPAGSRLVFQMHYTPNGKACTDQSSVGLIFAKEPPKHPVATKMVLSRSFAGRQEYIPAGDDNYRVEADFTFRQDSHLLSFMPHMHLRGKDFLFEATYPDGKKEVLLSVPHYNFNWQSVYRCAEPLALPKGTKLHCVAHFDNSAKNLNNPDPNRKVYWGDQTWDEMMIGWIDFYTDGKKP